jgi:stearoyl-CoA desaturase (delta-9 desaturase)
VPEPLTAIVAGLVVCQVAIFLTTVFLHRVVAHRSVNLAPPVRALFRTLLWLTTGVKPREWAAVHRRHHARTDQEGDPHSPLLLGFTRVLFTNAALYRRVARDGVTVKKYAKDLEPDVWDRYLFDHAFIGLGIGIAFLCLVLGWRWALLAAGVHTVTYLLLNGSINAVGHVFGRQPYPNTARNNGWLALLTAGEGWHNNHHAAPTSARLGLVAGELDPGWWLIRLLVACKGASVRLSEVRFKEPGERVTAGAR